MTIEGGDRRRWDSERRKAGEETSLRYDALPCLGSLGFFAFFPFGASLSESTSESSLSATRFLLFVFFDLLVLAPPFLEARSGLLYASCGGDDQSEEERGAGKKGNTPEGDERIRHHRLRSRWQAGSSESCPAHRQGSAA